MSTTTTASVTIDPKFPKLENGCECNGRVIRRGEERIGIITRVVEWERNAGMSERYTAKVVGYRVENWNTMAETEVATLAAATALARTF